MKLTPRDMDRLTVFTVAELARRRLGRGVQLSHPEAIALICDEMHEAARDGCSFEAVGDVGRSTLGAEQVMDGVADMIPIIYLEVMFPDGTKLVTIRKPIS